MQHVFELDSWLPIFVVHFAWMGPVEYKILRGDEDGDKMFLWLFAGMGQGFFSTGARMGKQPPTRNSPLPSLLHKHHPRGKGRARGHLYGFLAPQGVFYKHWCPFDHRHNHGRSKDPCTLILER